ncbi:MAG: hypothetical protein J5632_02620 [Bacteroidales bacterium]|nr:hypothetical protein [Bacteroidales bacterium]
MKYIKIFFTLALAALLAGCAKEQTEQDKIDGRVKDGKTLEVKYLRGSSEVQVLAFTHHAVKAEVKVEVNNPNLKWQLSSNRNWCTVAEGEHQGTDVVELNITANDGFEAREPATLTFVAGNYRGASIQVTQSASAFVIGVPYFFAGKDGGSVTLPVTTPEGTDWTIDNSEWISGAKGDANTVSGLTTTTVTLTAAANSGESRLGSVSLTAGAESDQIYIYQFGSELSYKTDGTILFDEGETSISVLAPESVVRSVTVPAFAAATIAPLGNGMDQITIALTANVSDLNQPREVPVSFLLNNSSATVLPLPDMVQGFTPSHGLNSPAGLKAFAQAVENGGDTSPWEQEGVVTMIQDIDMAGVTDWAGIGSAAHPFTGKFSGGGFALKNLRVSAPIFKVCNGATVSNLSIDKLSTITVNSGDAIGAIVAEAKGATKVLNCSFSGKLLCNGASDGVCIGGIVGKADENSLISECVVKSEAEGDDDDANSNLAFKATAPANAYIGGIVGSTLGEVSKSEMSGILYVPNCPANASIGGISSVANEDSAFSENSFRGTISLAGTTGKNVKIGGLFGAITDGSWNLDFATDKSVPAGEIKIAGFASDASTNLFAGGFTGYISEEVSLSAKGYTCQTLFNINHANAARKGNWFCVGGFLGGTDPDDLCKPLTLENVTNNGVIGINYKTSVVVQITRSCIGGIAGLVNGPATFKNCTNNAEIGKQTGEVNCSKSNGYSQEVGGLVGFGFGGNQLFEGCVNKANVSNLHYNNNPILFIKKPSDGTNNFYDASADGEGALYTCTALGGIIGAYNFHTTLPAGKLTMKSCSSEGKLSALRGVIGGIAGFAGNAEIENCDWKGSSIAATANKSDNQASDKGGIAGVLTKATVKGCTAKGNIETFRMGSAEAADGGGIVAYVIPGDAVTVEDCSYYGEISNGAPAQLGIMGGIIGRNDATTAEIKGASRYGGKIDGQTISLDNVTSLAAAHNDKTPNATVSPKLKPVTVTSVSLWNGN